MAQGIRLKFWDTEIESNLNATMKWLQIDNQMVGSQQPIILYPSAVAKNGNTYSSSSSTEQQNPSFFEISIFKLKDTTHGVDFYKYVGVLLQEVSLDVDEQLIRKIVEFWKSEYMKSDVADTVFENLIIPEPNIIEALGLPLYFENFGINPMKINFSFTKTEISDKKKRL